MADTAGHLCLSESTTRLRHVRDHVPRRIWLNYMEHPLESTLDDPPGALGLGQAIATRIYCAFYVFYYTTPMLAAVISDSYLGRYTTLLISAALYTLGCIILSVSSSSKLLEKGWGIHGLAVSMVLIGLGGGGFRATIVITDYRLTLDYIYNLYYWVGNLGSLAWFISVYIELHVGFAAAYGLATGFMRVAVVFIIAGRPYYMLVQQEKNALLDAVRIIACACRNGFSMAHTYPAHQEVRYHKTRPWSSQLVTEVTQCLQACRTLVAFIMYYICFDQMQNNLISQASQMKADGTPNDLLPALNTVGCIVLGPVIQHGLYPFLHRRHWYPSPVTKITIGFVFITLSMLYATIIQHVIYQSPPCYSQFEGCKYNYISVWLQAPVYFLISAGEIFAFFTALSYTYELSPESMKVLVQAVVLLIGAAGSACAMALTPLVYNPYLVYYYAALTAGMGFTTAIFWLVFKSGSNHHGLAETA
ncbi:hypothetical protein CC86DRAFT_397704 [Ophiobolus disseminans]|uniref:MFS general substrate transporter n=1 Tax=Ophiobolus disseminans TaxID=1469910 RepID=A0A6A6ZI26_9PLEO|nr:hypothetical protein CC86DRAFT_397704 [Ophiobolus disseminans]